MGKKGKKSKKGKQQTKIKGKESETEKALQREREITARNEKKLRPRREIIDIQTLGTTIKDELEETWQKYERELDAGYFRCL